MTFSGRSYAQWILAKSLERHMALSLRIRTRQSSAVLMYTQGLVDYSLLEVVHLTSHSPSLFDISLALTV